VRANVARIEEEWLAAADRLEAAVPTPAPASSLQSSG
jgi:hypothetical protein